MKAIFTIIIAIFAVVTVNAQSAVHTTVATTLSNDNVTATSATTFAKKASASRVLFSQNQNTTAQRLVVTNFATNEVLVSNTMEISNEFSVEKMNNLELETSTIATERVALEIED